MQETYTLTSSKTYLSPTLPMIYIDLLIPGDPRIKDTTKTKKDELNSLKIERAIPTLNTF